MRDSILPDCMYEHRLDMNEVNAGNKKIGNCYHCESDLYDDDEPYEIKKILICEHCIDYFKRASEYTELYM